MAPTRRSRFSPPTGSRRRSTSRSRPIPNCGPKSSAASCCRPARSASKSSAPPSPNCPASTEGAWWVQDAAASLPARLFGDVSGLRVADLCAAPGGKTAQLILAGAKVTAVDTSKNRLARLAQNLERLGLSRRHRPGRSAEIPAGGTVRRRAARRALLVDRHGAAAPRRAVDQDDGRRRKARRPAAQAARPRRHVGQTGRQDRLFQLLARPDRRRGLVSRLSGRATEPSPTIRCSQARSPASIRS